MKKLVVLFITLIFIGVLVGLLYRTTFEKFTTAEDEDVKDEDLLLNNAGLNDLLVPEPIIPITDTNTGLSQDNIKSACTTYVTDIAATTNIVSPPQYAHLKPRKFACDLGLYNMSIMYLLNVLRGITDKNSYEYKLYKLVIDDLIDARKSDNPIYTCKIAFHDWTQPVQGTLPGTTTPTRMPDRVFNMRSIQNVGNPNDWAMCFSKDPVASQAQAERVAREFVTTRDGVDTNYKVEVPADLSTVESPYGDSLKYSRISLNNLTDPQKMINFYCTKTAVQHIKFVANDEQKRFLKVRLNQTVRRVRNNYYPGRTNLVDIEIVTFDRSLNSFAYDHSRQLEYMKEHLFGVYYSKGATTGSFYIAPKNVTGTNYLFAFEPCSYDYPSYSNNVKKQYRVKWMTNEQAQYKTQDYMVDTWTLLSVPLTAIASARIDDRDLRPSSGLQNTGSSNPQGWKSFRLQQFIDDYNPRIQTLLGEIRVLEKEISDRSPKFEPGVDKEVFEIKGSNRDLQTVFSNMSAHLNKLNNHSRKVQRPGFKCGFTMTDTGDVCYTPGGEHPPFSAGQGFKGLRTFRRRQAATNSVAQPAPNATTQSSNSVAQPAPSATTQSSNSVAQPTMEAANSATAIQSMQDAANARRGSLEPFENYSGLESFINEVNKTVLEDHPEHFVEIITNVVPTDEIQEHFEDDTIENFRLKIRLPKPKPLKINLGKLDVIFTGIRNAGRKIFGIKKGAAGALAVGAIGIKRIITKFKPFAIRYTGFILAPETTVYTFRIAGTDSVDMHISKGGMKHRVFDGVNSTNIELEAGTYYEFEVRNVRIRANYQAQLVMQWKITTGQCSNSNDDCFTDIPNTAFWNDNNVVNRMEREIKTKQKDEKLQVIAKIRAFQRKLQDEYNNFFNSISPNEPFATAKARGTFFPSTRQGSKQRSMYISNDDSVYIALP